MINETLALRLLSGEPIEYQGITIPSLTLRDIKDIGYEEYAKVLSYVTFDLDDKFYEGLPKEARYLMPHQYFKLVQQDEQFLNMIFSFERVFKSKVNLNDNLEIVFESGDNKGKILSRDIYYEIINIIKILYGLADSESEKYVPADAKAEEIANKIKVAKEKLGKKNSGDAPIRFSDIISSVSTKSNSVNKFSVWDLTVYQLYDEYGRLQMIDEFNMNYGALLQGAKDIEMKHWSSNPKP